MVVAIKDMTTKAAQATEHRSKGAKVRELLLYCTVGVSLVALIILYGNYQVEHKQTPGFPIKWLGLLIISALLLRFATRAYRSFPDRGRFWRVVAIFGAAHFLAAVFVLTRVQGVTLGEFAVATVPEYFLLMTYLDHFLMRGR